MRAFSSSALGGNPFYCDCHLSWLSSWIKRDYIESGIARCTSPSKMANKLLLTSLFQCDSMDILFFSTSLGNILL